jgi:hypothetical protein
LNGEKVALLGYKKNISYMPRFETEKIESSCDTGEKREKLRERETISYYQTDSWEKRSK